MRKEKEEKKSAARGAWLAAASLPVSLRSLPLVLSLSLAAALPVLAFVPHADRIANATAKANEQDARTQPLQLELTLRVADREPIGTGQLVTHPTGLARLELRDAAQRIERHLLLGTEHTASRDGEELASPRAFLPPLFLLQVDSPATLQQALSDYGLDLEAAAIAPCGAALCYVLGDPSRIAPPPVPAEPDGGDPDAPLEEPRALIELGVDGSARPGDVHTPVLFVDTRSFEIVRIELASGVVVDLGPLVQFGQVRFPGFITILEPERDPIRFDIVGVTPVNAPAAVFQRAWLLTPVSPSASPPPGPSPDPRRQQAPGAPSGLR